MKMIKISPILILFFLISCAHSSNLVDTKETNKLSVTVLKNAPKDDSCDLLMKVDSETLLTKFAIEKFDILELKTVLYNDAKSHGASHIFYKSIQMLPGISSIRYSNQDRFQIISEYYKCH